MSLLKTIRAQLGLSVTPANNFTLTAEADNGTMKLARGNPGATTQDIIAVDASGKVTFTPADNLRPIGVGQTWQDVSGSRAVNTNYTNNTGRPIQLFITSAYGAAAAFVTVDGIIAGYLVGNGTSAYTGANPVVPPGSVYKVINATTFQNWTELR